MKRALAGGLLVGLVACAGRGPVAVSAIDAPVALVETSVGTHIAASTDTDGFVGLGWVHASASPDAMRAQRCRVRACGGQAPVLDLMGAAERRLLQSDPEERRLLDAYARGVNAAVPTLEWEPRDSVALTLLRGLRHATGLRTELGALAAQELSVLDLDDVLRDAGLPTEAEWDDLRGGLPAPTTLPDWLHTAPADASAVALGARKSPSEHAILGTVLGRRDSMEALVAVSLDTPGFSVVGLTEPGIPAFWAGRNDTLTWSLVPAYADALDLVVVGLEGDRYRAFGEDRVLLEGGFTELGPVVARGEGVGLVLRASGLDDSDETLPTLWRLARSEAVVPAVRAFDRPVGSAWHLVAADAEGHITDAVVGRVVRRRTVTGRVPHDVRDEDRWQGRVDRLPRLLDPPMGVVATTGARPAGPIAAVISTDFPSADRADRLVGAVAWQASADVSGVWVALTDDTVDIRATQSLFASTSPNTPAGRACADRLMRWEGSATTPPSAIWRAWRAALTDNTLSTWSDPAARAWRTTASVDPEPPGAPWQVRPAQERVAALDRACAGELSASTGAAGTLWPTSPGQAIAGALVVDLAEAGVWVWSERGPVHFVPGDGPVRELRPTSSP